MTAASCHEGRATKLLNPPPEVMVAGGLLRMDAADSVNGMDVPENWVAPTAVTQALDAGY